MSNRPMFNFHVQSPYYELNVALEIVAPTPQGDGRRPVPHRAEGGGALPLDRVPLPDPWLNPAARAPKWNSPIKTGRSTPRSLTRSGRRWVHGVAVDGEHVKVFPARGRRIGDPGPAHPQDHEVGVPPGGSAAGTANRLRRGSGRTPADRLPSRGNGRTFSRRARANSKAANSLPQARFRASMPP